MTLSPTNVVTTQPVTRRHEIVPSWRQYLTLIGGFTWLMLCIVPDVLTSLFHMFVYRSKKRVANEIVMVSGSGQGMGRALCIKFAELGSEIVCVDVDTVSNQETVRQIREIGGKARAFHCNIADQTSVTRLAKEVGKVDILVNNAGIYPDIGIFNASEEVIRRVVDVNLMSQMWTVQAFLPGMMARDHGHLVCISSMSALSGWPGHHPYAAAKAGLVGLMKTLWLELQNEGCNNVKLTTVFPYFVNTRKEIESISKGSKMAVLDMQCAVNDIFNGILEERSSFSVPHRMANWMNFTNFLPERFAERSVKLFVANKKKQPEMEISVGR